MVVPSRLIVLALSVLAVSVLVGCEKPPTPEQTRAGAVRAIGTRASITAMMVVDATRACAVAGIEKIDACAKQDGTLMPEREAKVLAQGALRRTDAFNAECSKNFAANYCADLLTRAIAMEWRKPLETSPTDAELIAPDR